MTIQWYRCMAAAALLKADIDPADIAAILNISASSVVNMARCYHLYSETPALRNWDYAQVAVMLPIASKIPDFFARMDIDPTKPISSRKLKKKIGEYKELSKTSYNAFNLIHDDDFAKIDGHYIPLSASDKEKIADVLGGWS